MTTIHPHLIDRPILGGTFPDRATDAEDLILEEYIANMVDVGITDVRLKYFRQWEDGSQPFSVLKKVLGKLEEAKIMVSIILVHADPDNDLLQGAGDYPNNASAVINRFNNEVYPAIKDFKNVWGFDVVAEPRIDKFDLSAQKAWWDEVSTAVRKDGRYKVYYNLLKHHLKYIEEIQPYSDLLAINYYYPRAEIYDNNVQVKNENDALINVEAPLMDYERFELQLVPEEESSPGIAAATINKMQREIYRFFNALAGKDLQYPVVIAQYGEHRGPREPVQSAKDPAKWSRKVWVTELGQKVWYDLFFRTLLEMEEAGKLPALEGFYLYDIGNRDTGFPIFRPPTGGQGTLMEQAPCCEAIRRAYLKIAERWPIQG